MRPLTLYLMMAALFLILLGKLKETPLDSYPHGPDKDLSGSIQREKPLLLEPLKASKRLPYFRPLEP